MRVNSDCKMIDIHIINDKAFVWNVEDVKILRREHHIIGMLVGTLAKAPAQNSFLGLPLQLMPEEATLLKEKGIGRLIHCHNSAKKNEEEVQKFTTYRERLFDEQITLCMEERKHQIKEAADKICEGKLRKMLKKQTPSQIEVINETHELDTKNETQERDDLLKSELDRVRPIQHSACMVQIFTACPWSTNCEEVLWKFPHNIKEKTRFYTFKSLWEKGYYLTSGQKFGGDFLVYKGDPHLCHAEYIAICLNWEEQLNVSNIIVSGRLATNVKKTLLYFSLDENSSLVCNPLTWMGIN